MRGERGRDPSAFGRRDLIGAFAIAAAGVALRLAFVSRFPTIPISDFAGLVRFGMRLRDYGWSAGGFLWKQLNPGLPIVLSLFDRVVSPGGPAVARVATAVATGCVGVIPFLVWRGVLSFPLRLASGLLFALWPGQILFSGVVAQDNWVLLPTVALAALAARVLIETGGRGRPVAAGLLYAAAGAIRQEMLLVLFPVLLVAAFGRLRGERRRWHRRAALLALAAGIPLLLLAEQRRAATGRFALTTEHGGLSLLGTVAPGAARIGWLDPRPFVAAVEPSLLGRTETFYTDAGRVAWREYRRRIRFETFRGGVQLFHLALRSDFHDLYWSLVADGVLPAPRLEAGRALADRLLVPLSLELGLIQGLFVAALLLAARRRDPAVLLIGVAVVLKFAVHALLSPLPRLILPATALELLALPLAARWLPGSPPRERLALAAIALFVPALLFAAVPALDRLLQEKDVDVPRKYQFPLAVAGVPRRIWCNMTSGRLALLGWGDATVEIFSKNPTPGERASVLCRVPPLDPGWALLLRLEDLYPKGGLPGRVVDRVEVDGREALRHDIGAEPFAGWLETPVTPAAGRPTRVRIEILAVRPDPGWSWGAASRARFEFVKMRTPRTEIRRVPDIR